MIDNRNPITPAVDRREETVTTQQPGYAATEQVTRDVAAERRQGADLVNQIVLALLGIVEIGLGLRLMLKLIAANANSGFADFIYGVTAPFIAPFTGLIGTPTAGANILEVTTLIAMGVYALFVWILLQGIAIASSRPSARTVSRSTREQTPGPTMGSGTDRTTHTLSS
jgi:YggT family protein